jgi:hypothetical protein
MGMLTDHWNEESSFDEISPSSKYSGVHYLAGVSVENLCKLVELKIIEPWEARRYFDVDRSTGRK